MDIERKAEEAVRLIVEDILARKGLRLEWDGIDDDIQDEIREHWRDLIIHAFTEES